MTPPSRFAAQRPEATDKLHGGTVDPAVMLALKGNADAAKAINPDARALSWAGISIAKRAAQVGRDHVDGLAYADACGASHSGLQTLRYTFDGDDEAPTLRMARCAGSVARLVASSGSSSRSYSSS